MAIGYVIVMIPLLVLPLLIQSRADMGLINNALLLYIVSLGLNISLGLTGMSNLCQAAFWGTGAYTAAILVTKFGLPFLVVVPVSVIVTAFVSMLLGLRLPGSRVSTLPFSPSDLPCFSVWCCRTGLKSPAAGLA